MREWPRFDGFDKHVRGISFIRKDLVKATNRFQLHHILREDEANGSEEVYRHLAEWTVYDPKKAISRFEIMEERDVEAGFELKFLFVSLYK